MKGLIFIQFLHKIIIKSIPLFFIFLKDIMLSHMPHLKWPHILARITHIVG